VNPSVRGMLRLCISLFAALFVGAAVAQSCDRETLQEVAGDGKIITTLSDQMFEVLGGDEITSALWLPASDELICARTTAYQGRGFLIYELINLDSSGERVLTTKLR
jgi:hypothetical protein